MTQTLGEFRVGISFNPGGHSVVNDLKRRAADFIDQVEVIKINAASTEVVRLCALAQSEMESAAMWAVKAATKPPRE